MARGKQRGGGGPVYSTRHGRMCSRCGWPESSCRCSDSAPAKPSGPAKVRYETHGRKGRGVTVVHEVPVTPDELAALGKELRKKCGSGGTVKDGAIEIQGDHRATVVAELELRGFAVRRAGG